MSSTMKRSPESVKTSQGMGDVSGQVRSSTQQQNLDAAKEKIPFPWTGKNLLSQDKHKVGHSFDQPYLDTKCELRRNARTEKVAQSKSSENDRKPRPGRKTCDDDDNELVKYMSSLPGFLQQVEKESNIQEKALNFGVLDWRRLEKWKYTERMPGKYPQKTSSSSKPRIGHNPSSLYSGKQAMPHSSRFSSPQRQPPHSTHLSSSKGEKNALSHKEEKYVELIKSKGKETCNQEYKASESINTDRQQDHFHQRVKFYDESYSETNVYNSKRKDFKKQMMSGKEASSSEQGKNKFSLPPHNNINAQGKRSEMSFDEIKFTSECRPADPQNIVLLKPKHFQKNGSESSQFTESRASLDGQLADVTGNRLSDFFSPQELKSKEFSVDIPRSCPLPSVTSVASESKCPITHKETARPSSVESKCPTTHKETARHSFIEASDKKQAEIAEQEQLAVKGRAPSPTRRFSFNIGRMSRSHSFKESSAVPQLSSTYTTVKSGPVRPENSSGMDNFKSDQANPSSRARSSPLRRLLDPLLKHKGAHSAETVAPPNGSLPSKGSKPEVSTLQALLQLSLKNGLPFFKFVVNNSNDMLAAAVKRLPTSGKSDPCMTYAFYSVHEIRKKSMNWINQGSKSKSCGLGYNIVGQMKISSSYHLKVNARNSSECDVRECVLYGVDPGQGDKQALDFIPNKEIAAVIVKNSSKMLNGRGLGDENQLYEENKNPSGTVVILPGGVHGGGEQKNKPFFSLKPFSNGFYSIDFDASISLLEAFATCVAYVTCSKFPEIIDVESLSSAEHFPETMLGTDKRRTPTTFQEQLPAYVTCPPLSPAGRI
ncbi:hypothetical protein DH2020_045999 [Rehmannia glutinosa]|uniref:Uncharacterized protein n=1 Tax=Rehmannia glutinosa TaxID=99300 RepID=A0ABR0UCP4_REHGL